MNNLLNKLSTQLIDKKLKLITVESCTGGWISKLITDRAGSSDWFECGIITYSNEAKQKLVNVDSNLLEKYGAVSRQVAHAMAQGASQLFSDCISLSVTGIAGPSGGSEAKPVGLVYLSVAFKNNSKTIKCDFSGSRDKIRSSAINQGLNLVSEFLDQPTNT
ncbi:MAG: CinA family protein [Kangiellaceae bacterium]